MQKPSRSHRPVIFIVSMALVLSVAPAQGQATAHPELITADANAPSRPFPHFWEKMFGSGRVILSLRERYGIDEVARWYFEVWNEPNIDFWAGEPKQATYWQLYDHTARAIKKVNTRLRVGGPATAQAAWVDAFIEHCARNNVPLDFVSTHVYGNDRAQDVFGTNENIPRDKMVCRA